MPVSIGGRGWSADGGVTGACRYVFRYLTDVGCLEEGARQKPSLRHDDVHTWIQCRGHVNLPNQELIRVLITDTVDEYRRNIICTIQGWSILATKPSPSTERSTCSQRRKQESGQYEYLDLLQSHHVALGVASTIEAAANRRRRPDSGVPLYCVPCPAGGTEAETDFGDVEHKVFPYEPGSGSMGKKLPLCSFLVREELLFLMLFFVV